jgi:DNA-binding Xre family transcriptional regulator
MARRGIPKDPPIWYLRAWMQTMGLDSQVEMMSRTGWSKAKMSQLYNDKQDFNSAILLEASTALNCAPHELLMHPDDAMRARRMVVGLQAAAETTLPFQPLPPEFNTLRDGTHG